MNTEGHELVACPTHVAHVEPRGAADLLYESKLVLQPVKTVVRPCERRELRQQGDITHVEPHVDESAAMPAEGADLTDRHARSRVQPGEFPPIESRFRVDAQRRAT